MTKNLLKHMPILFIVYETVLLEIVVDRFPVLYAGIPLAVEKTELATA